MLALLLACGASGPAEPTPPVPATEGAVPTEQTVPTLFGEVQGVSFVGDWTSPACSGRAYARNVHFDADQQYAVIDLVSPCPTGTTCAWSGMIQFGGLWAIDGLKLRVQEIGGSPAGLGGPHPVLFEATADGTLQENGCIYQKGLTVPAGYEEDRVRPKVPR